MVNLSFIFVILNSLLFVIHSVKFTAKELHSLTRLSQSTPSSNGKFLVYALRNWDNITSKVSSHFEYINIVEKTTGLLTSKENGSESNPYFSFKTGNTLFFLSSRSGSSQIWTLQLPDEPSPEPPKATQLTNYTLDISSFKLANNGTVIVFSTEVYLSCPDSDFDCTKNKDKEIESRGKNTYQAYDKLMMRHWDKWLNDKVSHLFAQKYTYDDSTKTVKLDGTPFDLMKNLNSNSPVGPFGGNEMYDISNDGSEVAFSAADRTKDEAWNTGWKIYTSLIKNESTEPVHLTKLIKARTTLPKYSPDDSILAYLSMDRVGLESDKFHLETYYRKTGNFINQSGDRDQSISDYAFSHEFPKLVYFISTSYGANTLNTLELKSKIDELFPHLTNLRYKRVFEDEAYDDGVPRHIPGTTNYIIERHSLSVPVDSWVFESIGPKITKLTNINTNFNQYDMSSAQSFRFTGAKNDTVQGWILKPTNFDEKKTYPIALLIHGGPESAFTNSFSYRWNPQIWANHGYGVIAINPHGSVGQGQNYTDAVLNDWGGAPYEDLMKGLDYAILNNKWLDGNRACAVGGSYGGYMINWIQGNTDRFKCLVCHDGVFSFINMFYATEEMWFPMAEYCKPGSIGCKPWDSEDVRKSIMKFSPETLAANWKTPELVIHGSLDYRIPVSEALSMFTTLQLKKVPSRLLHFPKENHWVLKAENSMKWYDEVLAWLDKYTNNK